MNNLKSHIHKWSSFTLFPMYDKILGELKKFKYILIN